MGKAIGYKVLGRIERHLGAHLRDDPGRLESLVGTLHHAVLGPAGVARLREYEEWIDRWARRSRSEWGQRVIMLREKLRDHKIYGSYFRDFEAKRQARGLAPNEPVSSSPSGAPSSHSSMPKTPVASNRAGRSSTPQTGSGDTCGPH